MDLHLETRAIHTAAPELTGSISIPSNTFAWGLPS
jgi:hypothetical protein